MRTIVLLWLLPGAIACADDIETPGPGPDPEVCPDPAWAPKTCSTGTVAFSTGEPAVHVADDTPIAYARRPPASGPHRGSWARWGEYEYLPPERWLHNLEHGGAAFLYHPCAEASFASMLREIARARPDDAGGRFRWILTPYAELPTSVAVVTWDWIYSASCVDAAEIGRFLDEHYRRAPEDAASDGSFEERYIGR